LASASDISAPSRLFRSTAFRLTLLYMGVFAMFATAALGYVAWNARRLIEDQIRQTIDAEITGLSEQFRQGGIRRLVLAIEQRARGPGASLYLVTSPFGERLAGNVEQVPAGLLDRAGESEIPYARGAEEGQGTRPALAIVRVYVLPAGFRVLVGRDASERDRLRQVVRRAGGWALAVVLLLGVIGGFVIARRVLKRVDAMSATTVSIMASDLKDRLPVSGNGDELDRLAINLNTMLDRIALLLGGLRQVSDNIAHDLKTPLTRLRNRADEALRPGAGEADMRRALDGVIEDADNLIRVFNALLMIARLEAGQARETMAPFDATATTTSVAELYEAVAEEAGVHFTCQIEPGIAAIGSRELIGQALANMVDNALKYGRPPGAGAFEVTLSMRQTGQTVTFTVADRGPGIPPEQHARALERFGRLDSSRSQPGFGLGLSLVNAIAHIHGGTLDLKDHAPGLAAVLTIPAQSAGNGHARNGHAGNGHAGNGHAR
jgi:signal transduction histidine kinase